MMKPQTSLAHYKITHWPFKIRKLSFEKPSAAENWAKIRYAIIKEI